jgi:hypothetical protein
VASRFTDRANSRLRGERSAIDFPGRCPAASSKLIASRLAQFNISKRWIRTCKILDHICTIRELQHREYIEARIADGCHCPEVIWPEVRARGYTGSRSSLRDCVVRLLSPQGKDSIVRVPVRTMPVPSARRAFGWLAGWKKLNPDKPRGDEHERFVLALCDIEPSVAEVRSLTRQFLGIMHRRRPEEFDSWLERLERCGVKEMQGFAVSLRSDLPAVRAAFTLPWRTVRPRARSIASSS